MKSNPNPDNRYRGYTLSYKTSILLPPELRMQLIDEAHAYAKDHKTRPSLNDHMRRKLAKKF
jgi:hypothetical protein